MSVTVGRARRDRGILVARPSALGNPFVIGKDGDRRKVIEKYREWFASAILSGRAMESFERIVQRARTGDVTLLCYCAPLPCHADVIAEEVRLRLVGFARVEMDEFSVDAR
jgi:hypothetical protein